MRKLLIASTLVLAAGSAHAADNGFYLGAAVSQAQIDDVFGSGSDIEIDDTAWKLIAGFRPIDLLAVEANYMDLGSESASFGVGSASADAKAFSGYLLGYLPLPLPLIDVYGKVGLARWELEGETSGIGLISFDESGTEFAWGGGGQLNFGSLSARLEYENFDIDETDGLELISLGLTWTFL